MSIRERNLRWHYDKKLRERDAIIKAQDEYIEFLGEQHSALRNFCYVSGQWITEELSQKGKDLREKIKNLKNERT
jgi:hypothetical protein